MKKGLVVVLAAGLIVIFASERVEGIPVEDVGTWYSIAALNATQEATAGVAAAQEEKNFIQKLIQGSQTLQAVVTGAQWAQSTVKGIQDQLSFFNDVRNYIESVDDVIDSVTGLYDTVQSAGEDIDNTNARWDKLMKGNYNDINGIKEALSEAAHLADNLDDHAEQLEKDAIKVSRKARMHDRMLDELIKKTRKINPLKAADPTVALLHMKELQATVEQQKIWNEVYLRESLKALQEERVRVEQQKGVRETYKNIADSLQEAEPSEITHPGLLFSKQKK